MGMILILLSLLSSLSVVAVNSLTIIRVHINTDFSIIVASPDEGICHMQKHVVFVKSDFLFIKIMMDIKNNYILVIVQTYNP